MTDKLAAARRWLAEREAVRGRHRYIPAVPTVLVPVLQRYAERLRAR